MGEELSPPDDRFSERGRDKGRPLALDPDAISADEDLPAFLARPKGAPVYYGFPILEDVEVEGFKLGKISDFEAENYPEDDPVVGDAFVVAPDNSRAGLIWEVSEEAYFQEVCPIEADRWGVWAVAFHHPMKTRADALLNLEDMLPLLKEKWQIWREKYGSGRHKNQ
jgi:hypothetical protein